MTTAGFLWPTKEEYDVAIARWQDTIFDSEVRSGMLAYDNMGILSFGGANLYVCVYKIGNWMVRCFCSKPKYAAPVDICERYMAIDRFCHNYAGMVSALIPVTYLDQGIVVSSRILPIVKMPFLADCPSLGEFILDHYSDRAMMQQLSDAWFRMIREMEAAPVAHGDLDLSNVLVQQAPGGRAGLTLKLIDYDNMWLPELDGRAQTEFGHVHFQHPDFLPPRQRPYGREMDRFSALVMYISLKALAIHPELYEAWGADESDRLLLCETDYLDASLVGSHIMQLRDQCGPGMQPYIEELLSSLRESRMPLSLCEIANGNSSTYISYRPPATPPPQVRPTLAPPVFKWSEAVYNVNNLYPFQGQSGSYSAASFQVHQGPVQQPLVPGAKQKADTRSTRKVKQERATQQFPDSDSGLTYGGDWDAQNGYAGQGMAQQTMAAVQYRPSSAAPNSLPPEVWNAGANTPLPDFAESPIARRRRILITVGIVLLVLIIIVASIALYVVLSGNHHLGPLTLGVGLGLGGRRRRKGDSKAELPSIRGDGRPQGAIPSFNMINGDGRPQGAIPSFNMINGDGRPQGATPSFNMINGGGRPQGATPSFNMINGDGHPYTTSEEIEGGRPHITPEGKGDGRPQGATPPLHTDYEDGRPQGATPPLHTAPVPTMYDMPETLSYIVGRGDEWWMGVAPCGRPSSQAASVSLNRILPCGRPSSQAASLEWGDL